MRVCPELLGPHVGTLREPLFFGGSSKTEQKQSTSTTTTTNTTSNQTDARKGVSDQGILLESGDLDQSVRIEEVSAEVVATAVAPVESVANNAINKNTQATEAFLDNSSEIFNRGVGLAEESLLQQNKIASRAVDSSENIARESLIQNTGFLKAVSTQNANLAGKVLEDAKGFVNNANSEAGERLGSQVITVGGAVLGLGLLIFIFIKK